MPVYCKASAVAAPQALCCHDHLSSFAGRPSPLVVKRLPQHKKTVASSWKRITDPSCQPGEAQDVLQAISSLLQESLLLKESIDAASPGTCGIGPDMRDRVDRLQQRIRLLQQSAERAVRSSGRAPAQLIAVFKGLEREHRSLENIVKLAMEAGPVLVGVKTEGNFNPPMMGEQRSVLLSKEAAESTCITLFQDLNSDNNVEVISIPKYVMSTPSSEGAPQLSKVRAEIERRVMEQLVKKEAGQPMGSIRPLAQRSSVLQSGPPCSNAAQKVPSVMGQMSEKDADESLLTNDLLQWTEEDKYGSQASRIERLEAQVKKMELENSRSISIELHDQVVSRLKMEIDGARYQLQQSAGKLDEKDALLTDLKRDLLIKQQHLYKKVQDLSSEVARRITAEDLNAALKASLIQMENMLKMMQNRVESLDSILKEKERKIAVLQEGWHKGQKDSETQILNIKERLSSLETMQEEYIRDNLVSELRDIGDLLGLLQEEQKCEQVEQHKTQEKVKLLESVVHRLEDHVKDLANDSIRRAEVEEMRDCNMETLVQIERDVKHIHDLVTSFSKDLGDKENVIELLQEELNVLKTEQKSESLNFKSDLFAVQKIQRDLLSEEPSLGLRNVVNKLTILEELCKQEKVHQIESDSKIRLIEKEVLGFAQKLTDAEVQRQVLFDDVKVLVKEMLKDFQKEFIDEFKAASSSQTSTATESNMELVQNRDVMQSASVWSSTEQKFLEGTQSTEERAASLEIFFSAMGQLIRQEIERIHDTSTRDSTQSSLKTSGVDSENLSEQLLCDAQGQSGNHHDDRMEVNKSITVIYETNWKRAYLHYSADHAEWTEIPGILMEQVYSKGRSYKILKVEAEGLEFVLTDGEGNWDRHPSGQNYIISRQGDFELSAGLLKAVTAI